VARRPCTVTSFYRYAEEERLLAPLAGSARTLTSHRLRVARQGLDRNEVGALVTAGLGEATEHALVSLLALNGLRVSDAAGADIDKLGLERGHRTLTILSKGGKIVTIPLAPRTARAIDLALGERLEGRSSPVPTVGVSTATPRAG
jgi:integrase/recombinase XerD